MCLIKIVHFLFCFAILLFLLNRPPFFSERASVAYRVLVVPLRGAVA